MDIIPRYDEDYFNCYMGHVVSYIKHKGVPVEYVFYSCMESTERIYHHFLISKQNRWKFLTNFCEVALLGVNIRCHPFGHFDLTKTLMMELIDQGKVVFLIGDGYYVPHRVYSYNKIHEPHWFMLSGYRETEQGHEWFVQDHARPDFHDYYGDDILRVAYNSLDYPGSHRIDDFEFDEERVNHPDTQLLYRKFKDFFEKYADDFSMFENIMHTVMTLQSQITESSELLHEIESAYFFLASSRELFRRFVEVMNLDDELHEKLRHSILLAHSVKGAFARARVTKKLDMSQFTERSRKLEELERSILSLIQRKFLKVTA